jgi:hypothetical protein
VGLCFYEVLLLVHDSTPVEEDTLEPDSLVVMDIPVEEGNFVEEDIPVEEDNFVEVDIPVAGQESLAERDTFVVVHIPVVDRLEEAFATQQCQIVVVRVDQGFPHSYLLVVARTKVFLLGASQVVILLQVVRLVVPDRS